MDHHGNTHAATPGAGERVRDPVCGMMVDPATAVSAEHGGKTYHFCCDGCRKSFVADPKKYLEAKPFELPPRKPMAHAAAPAAKPVASKAIDPVCGMSVDPATARSAEHAGTTYYFCSEGCRTKFTADPDKYLNKADAADTDTMSMAGTRTITTTTPLLTQLLRSYPLPGGRGGTGCRNRDQIHLPHASADRARRAGRLPDLRHGA